jgi:hypothetical protein
VQDQHRVARAALRIRLRRAEAALVQLELGQHLAAGEAEVLGDVVAFGASPARSGLTFD